MEEKFKEYRKYDWTLCDKWQKYLTNIYPTPSREKLEKMRKKWYKLNVDKEFDETFEPGTQSEQPKGRSGYSNF